MWAPHRPLSAKKNVIRAGGDKLYRYSLIYERILIRFLVGTQIVILHKIYECKFE